MSRGLTDLVAGSLVLLLAASRAILPRAQAAPTGQTGESAEAKADLASRIFAFRSLFNTEALLLAAAALEVATLYSWPGSMFDGASEAPASFKTTALLGGGFAWRAVLDRPDSGLRADTIGADGVGEERIA